jgi:uncharacterized membrane protein YhaH (DUF805 family)
MYIYKEFYTEGEEFMRKPTIGSLFSLQGRMARSQFICAIIALFIICGLIVVLSALLVPPPFTILILTITGIVFFWLYYVVFTVKRLHDLNLSAWYWLLLLAWNIFVGAFQKHTAGHHVFISIVLALPTLILLFMPGTRGRNKFGEDPKVQHRDH